MIQTRWQLTEAEKAQMDANITQAATDREFARLERFKNKAHAKAYRERWIAKIKARRDAK